MEYGGKKLPEVYIIINSYESKVTSNSLLDAVQYCFKSIICLNRQWPDECPHLWNFVWKHVCKLKLKGAKLYVSVTNSITDIKKIRKGSKCLRGIVYGAYFIPIFKIFPWESVKSKVSGIVSILKVNL